MSRGKYASGKYASGKCAGGKCAKLAAVLLLVVSFQLSFQRDDSLVASIHAFQWNHSLVASIHAKQNHINDDDDNEPYNPNLTYVYSVMRKERSGMMIMEMLEAHAYAYARREDLRYGGACQVGEDMRKQTLSRYNATQAILKRIGLDRELPFLQCPSATKPGRIVPREEYDTLEMDRLWTPDWIRHMQAHLKYSNLLREDNVSSYRVAVHVRRGDVSPCKHRGRYLTNAHYLRLLERYVPWYQRWRTKVEVFSETDSFEPWSDFGLSPFWNGTVQLFLDTPLPDVWERIITADLVLLSRSPFAFIPAMLNRHGRVIYTWQFRKKLPMWEEVPPELLQLVNEETAALAQQCPPQNSTNATTTR